MIWGSRQISFRPIMQEKRREVFCLFAPLHPRVCCLVYVSTYLEREILYLGRSRHWSIMDFRCMLVACMYDMFTSNIKTILPIILRRTHSKQ